MRAPQLKADIAVISAHYDFLVDVIEKLENSYLALSESLDLFDSVSLRLASAPGIHGIAIRDKLKSVITKNTGLGELNKVRSVIEDQGISSDILKKYTIDEVLHLRFAPITSCDVERAFSHLKLLLTDRQQSFKLDNFGKHLAIEFHLAIRIF